MTEQPVRAFVAFEIPSETKQEIGRFCEAIRERPDAGDLRFVRPEILHLTVRFFGDLNRKQLDRAEGAIQGLDGLWVAPDLTLGKIGAFPSARRPQVLWLGIDDPQGGLQALVVQTDRAIRVSGFGPADKPFVAHITLARVARGRRSPDLNTLTADLTAPQGALTIRSITLFRSELRPGGPIYSPLVIARPRVSSETGEGERSIVETPRDTRRTGQDPIDTKEGEFADG